MKDSLRSSGIGSGGCNPQLLCQIVVSKIDRESEVAPQTVLCDMISHTVSLFAIACLRLPANRASKLSRYSMPVIIGVM